MSLSSDILHPFTSSSFVLLSLLVNVIAFTSSVSEARYDVADDSKASA